jgi:hypothetical protein
MPLLDHFHAPLSIHRPWQGFHSAWAATLAQQLNAGVLPSEYFAMPNIQLGRQIEIDVATLEDREAEGALGGGTATAVWAPPRPAISLPVDFSEIDVIEVQIADEEGSPRLRGAIELVSPANKDRASHRQAFAIKCASYLQQGVAVIIVDVVTSRSASLHDELLQLLRLPANGKASGPLYAVSYRAARTSAGSQLEVWLETLALAAELPTLPLWLADDLVLPLELEPSYRATCEALRIH